MKIILVGENHLDACGPSILFQTLMSLKQLKASCLLALEISSMDNIDCLYFTKGFYEESVLLARLQRKLLILSSIAVYPTFAADLASSEEDNSLRDDIMATEILEHRSDITVMLVGLSHIENLSKKLKTCGAEVLCFVPKHVTYPNIIPYIVRENGFFYSNEPGNDLIAQKRIEQFTGANRS